MTPAAPTNSDSHPDDRPGLTARQLADVCRADLQRRRRAGEAVRAEDYLARFPGAFADAENVLALIFGEFLVREDLGEKPTPAEYEGRFPHLAAALNLQFQLHAALADGHTPNVDAPEVALPAGVDLPGLTLLDELGRGGAGVVFRARQHQPDRIVAVKVLSAGKWAGATELSRFVAEAEAIGRLQHPNVVQVHSAGQAGGQPYFVLEFVSGGSLADRLARGPLDPRAAAALVRTVAAAVDDAHQSGVIHRDLKPANILLAAGDVPKVTDFGLAKRLDVEQGPTTTGAILGTPSYMAPEQVACGAVGPAADVYALGAVLYECLTGRPPFRAATVLETLDQVRGREPVAVRQLQPGVPRDLETVCLKCLHKDASKRYASAAALAGDLQRYLEGRPVLARPIGPLPRVVRWVRRNRAAAALIAALVVGTTAATALAMFALSERDRANANAVTAGQETARAEARAAESLRNQYLAHASLAASYLRANNVPPAIALLDRYRTPSPPFADPRGWEWFFCDRACRTPVRTLPPHPATQDSERAPVRAASTQTVAYHPDGRRVATTGHDTAVRIWDAATGELLRTLDSPGRSGYGRSLAISRNGRLLAATCSDRTIRLWDPDSGNLVRAIRHQPPVISAIAFSPDGELLAAVGSEQSGVLFRVAGGELLHDSPKTKRATHDGVAFSPDGRQFIFAEGNDVHLHAVATGERVRSFVGHGAAVYGAAFMPDGKRIATVSGDQVGALWDVETGRSPVIFRGHVGAVVSLAVSPGGDRVATGGRDQTLRVWDAATGQQIAEFPHPAGWAADLAFSPDGAHLASAGSGGVSIWAVGAGNPRSLPDGGKGAARSIAWRGDGTMLFTAGSTPEVRGWDVITGRPGPRFGPHDKAAYAVAVSADGHRIATVDRRHYRLWDAAGKLLDELRLPGPPIDERCDTAVSADLNRVAFWGGTDSVMVVDVKAADELRPPLKLDGDPRGIAFSPDGNRLAIGTFRGTLWLWDLTTGEAIERRRAHRSTIWRVVWTADGSHVLTTGMDGDVTLFDARTASPRRTFTGHTSAVTAAAFTADGRRLATAGEDRTLRIWDIAGGQQLLVTAVPGLYHALRFSPGGDWLAAAGMEGAVYLYDGRPLTAGVQVEREAVALLDSFKTLPRPQVADKIRASRGTPGAVREAALELLERP